MMDTRQTVTFFESAAAAHVLAAAVAVVAVHCVAVAAAVAARGGPAPEDADDRILMTAQKTQMIQKKPSAST